MTHARTALPAISPVHAGIAAHRAAYDAFQVAPEGDTSMDAETAYDDASMALVAVVCATGTDALALFRHLVWWVQDEAEYAAGHEPAYSIALARARDLSLLLASMTRPAPIPQARPSGRIAVRIPRRAVQMIDVRPHANDEDATAFVGWEPVTPARPNTALVRALRVVELAGEALTAVAIIAGGVFAYGYLPLA